MKALTVKSNDWFSFTIEDIPTMIDSDTFVLLKKVNSPKLQLKTIRRGDVATGLFEGDVIVMDNTNWLVCYERGFYVISDAYVIRYLHQISDYKVIGTADSCNFSVPINFKANHLFKYKNTIFRFNDIIGGYKDKIIVRACKKPIEPSDIQQECCMSVNGCKIYLDDVVDGKKVLLHNGRICYEEDSVYIDFNGGGIC